MPHRVLLSSGGTGGHIFPALALAEELRRRSPEVDILFLGGRYGPEGRLAAQAGLEFSGLPARGFIGRGFLKGAAAALLLLASVWQALGRLRRFKPEVVVGFGGYAAAAGLLAARLLGIPSLVHEQNSIPGAVNCLLGRGARRICLSFPETEKYFPQGKCVFTGNPVRGKIRSLGANPTSTPRDKAENILVLGGSQGARAINNAILEDLTDLLRLGTKLRIQCGQADFARMREESSAYPPERVKIEAFIDDMYEAYSQADLVICRAGASTLAELAAAGLPAILIPLPSAAHNHQMHNAEQVQKQGAARLLEQKDLQKGRISRLATDLLQDRAALRAMSQASLKLANPEAAGKLADETEKLLAEAKGGQSA
ncbi:MAG: undecaprenyldiphospho-muramoylpentapeptide beta-N-acetylglucosaminyltransferase [Desulfovibrionaceae bacterium]|nr:undecaprenyldiphospho-muramoylpentapeptide beta-N-acetylglucosaminyltransferase [Desulfovibrionaceae bacterium]